SLRLRLFAIVLAAALVPIAPLSIVLLLQVRDGIYGRAVADARARLADVVQRCSGGSCPDVAGVRKFDRPCTTPGERVGELLLLCEDVPGGSIQLGQNLRPVREQLGTLSRRVLATLAVFVAVLVVVAVWLLERGIGRRLERIDSALEAVGAVKARTSRGTRSASCARRRASTGSSGACSTWPARQRRCRRSIFGGRWTSPRPRSRRSTRG